MSLVVSGRALLAWPVTFRAIALGVRITPHNAAPHQLRVLGSLRVPNALPSQDVCGKGRVILVLQGVDRGVAVARPRSALPPMGA